MRVYAIRRGLYTTCHEICHRTKAYKGFTGDCTEILPEIIRRSHKICHRTKAYAGLTGDCTEIIPEIIRRSHKICHRTKAYKGFTGDPTGDCTEILPEIVRRSYRRLYGDPTRYAIEPRRMQGSPDTHIKYCISYSHSLFTSLTCRLASSLSPQCLRQHSHTALTWKLCSMPCCMSEG
jgi:hypothetical protein